MVWDNIGRDKKTFQKKDKIIAQIVDKSGIIKIFGMPLYKTNEDVLTISSVNKDLSMDELKKVLNFGDIDNLKDQIVLIKRFYLKWKEGLDQSNKYQRKNYKPQQISIKTFFQPFNISLGTE